MKIAVCDDSKIINRALVNIIKDYPFDEEIEVDGFLMGLDLIHSINEEKVYDIVFMDIRLSTVDKNDIGTKYAAAIKQLYPQTLIIYISSFTSYTFRVANAEPFLFLYKPLTKENVHRALDKAVNRISKTFRKYYYFSKRDDLFRVDLNEVLYISSAYKKITIKTKTGFYTFRGNREKVFEEVNMLYPYFLQANKSILVNFAYVTNINRKYLMVGAEQILISRKFDNICYNKIKNIVGNEK